MGAMAWSSWRGMTHLYLQDLQEIKKTRNLVLLVADSIMPAF
jgi:hypothetical protein